MDIEEIADDIFEVIGQYLCWIEKIAFKRTSKKLSAIIKEETIEELIEKRLTYLGIEGKNIIQELKKTNTVISGSFILQCIYNVSWKDSDIDFFSKIPSMENIKEKILSKAADINSSIVSSFIIALSFLLVLLNAIFSIQHKYCPITSKISSAISSISIYFTK